MRRVGGRRQHLPFGAPERGEARRAPAKLLERLFEVPRARRPVEVVEEPGEEAPRIVEDRLVALASGADQAGGDPRLALLRRAVTEALGVSERIGATNQLAPGLVGVADR